MAAAVVEAGTGEAVTAAEATEATGTVARLRVAITEEAPRQLSRIAAEASDWAAEEEQAAVEEAKEAYQGAQASLRRFFSEEFKQLKTKTCQTVVQHERQKGRDRGDQQPQSRSTMGE